MEEKHPLVYAVITNWNGFDDTLECIESLKKFDYPNYKVVISDNGSTDDSPERLAKKFPDIPVLHTGDIAVTATYNAGIQFGLDNGADYILLLNNDVTFDPEMMTKLVAKAESDPSIGLVTPKIYYYDRPDVIWFAGGMRNRFDFGAYDTFEGEHDSAKSDQEREVDLAWACGFLMRRDLLEKMGLFDTRFYLYYDDVDISIRTYEAGYRIWYVPDAVMWHKVSHSTGNKKFARIWARSKMRLYRKYTSGLHFIGLVIYAFGHALLRAIFPREDNLRMHAHTSAYLHGLVDGLKAWTGEETQQI